MHCSCTQRLQAHLTHSQSSSPESWCSAASFGGAKPGEEADIVGGAGTDEVNAMAGAGTMTGGASRHRGWLCGGTSTLARELVRG